MQLSLADFRWKGAPAPGGVTALLLAGLLWAPVAPGLWSIWQSSPALSHGPLVPLVAALLLWSRRDALGTWDHACFPGLLLTAACGGLSILASWAAVDFLQPISLIGMGIGAVWFLGGREGLRAAAGPLGFLVFMIPWPTTLVERLAFPLQLTSSAYAAILCGFLGLPIQREGIHLAVLPDPAAPPVYTVLVARECSGLTSLMVLLALGYLFACLTPARAGWKLALLLLVVPLALLANSVRLALILLAGARHSPGLAAWVHDHEAPVLIFLCCLGLLAAREGLLSWIRSPDVH